MNILFLTLSDFSSLDFIGIYPDLLNVFLNAGHRLYIISPTENRKKIDTHIVEDENVRILKLKIGNVTKTNLLQKGLSTLTIESKFKQGIKSFFHDVKFDLILYSTPPITLYNAIRYVKKRDNAKTYLMLKDIFPQNALDINILKKNGIKGLIYRYFKIKEKNLYLLSDFIGCMSPANKEFLLANNAYIDKKRVGLCPNALKFREVSVSEKEKEELREHYGLPENKMIFVYGGNLGKPQGIDYVIQCLEAAKDINDVFFLIIGSGTEYYKIEDYIKTSKNKRIKLIRELPTAEFDKMLVCCDIGLIFLDHRFTIPNFPSRVLSYMQAQLPVLSVTDMVTDIGRITVENGFGFWCESNNCQKFVETVNKIISEKEKLLQMKPIAKAFLCKEYDPAKVCQSIINTVQTGEIQ